MRGTVPLGAAVLLVFVFSALIWHFSQVRAPQDPEYPGSKSIRYSFTVRNEQGSAVDGAVFRVYSPVAETSHQKVEGIEANAAFDTLSDDQGNQVLG